MKKVTLREQLRQDAFEITTYKMGGKEGKVEVIAIEDVLTILAPFLEPSPQTTEIQKEIESGYKILKQWSNNVTFDNYPFGTKTQRLVSYEVARLQIEHIEKKMEAFFADHVSREKLKKLIEDLKQMQKEQAGTGLILRPFIEISELMERLVALEKGGE